MDDRFKFRTWNRTLKTFTEHNILTNPTGNEELSIHQCTGQRDRYEQLIYEGDIVQHCSAKTNWIVYWNSDKGKWDTRGAFYKWDGRWASDRRLGCTTKRMAKFVVIGNVFTNPEYLEGATNGHSGKN